MFKEFKKTLKNDNIKITEKYVVRGLSIAWWIIRIFQGASAIMIFCAVYTYLWAVTGW